MKHKSFDFNPEEDLFGSELESFALRKSMVARHPMFDQDYTIETEATSTFYDVVYDWVLLRKSGLYMHALPRQGKSKAIELLIEKLQANFPFVCFRSIFAIRGIPTPGQFSIDWLEQWGYNTNSLKPARATGLLITTIKTHCALNNGRIFIVFIDEAQLYTINQYRHMHAIWNALRADGYFFITVLVGQPELTKLVGLLGEADLSAVTHRFFVKPLRFDGIKSKEALASFLASYDAELTYPKGSNWSYSRFFVRNAFDGGWRLKSEDDFLWNALMEMLPNKKISKQFEGFKMAWLVDAVHSFLMDAMALDEKGRFETSKKLWTEILEGSTRAELIA
jgi:hypothetical protein